MDLCRLSIKIVNPCCSTFNVPRPAIPRSVRDAEDERRRSVTTRSRSDEPLTVTWIHFVLQSLLLKLQSSCPVSTSLTLDPCWPSPRPTASAPPALHFAAIMETTADMDLTMVLEIRAAVKECSERGLSASCKWSRHSTDSRFYALMDLFTLQGLGVTSIGTPGQTGAVIEGRFCIRVSSHVVAWFSCRIGFWERRSSD